MHNFRNAFVSSKGQISESIQKATELWANPDLTECFSDQKQQFMQTLQLVSEQIQVWKVEIIQKI